MTKQRPGSRAVVREWVRQGDIDGGHCDGLTTGRNVVIASDEPIELKKTFFD